MHAKNVALQFMNPAINIVEFEGGSFRPMIHFPPPNEQYYYALWCISFCPKNEFCCFPNEVYVSLFGTIELTNPRDLHERLKEQKGT
jgi:hypothetical protein